MCDWLNENHVAHNISFRQIGWQTCTSIWMSEQDMIYFKLKWDNHILAEDRIQELEGEANQSPHNR